MGQSAILPRIAYQSMLSPTSLWQIRIDCDAFTGTARWIFRSYTLQQTNRSIQVHWADYPDDHRQGQFGRTDTGA